MNQKSKRRLKIISIILALITACSCFPVFALGAYEEESPENYETDFYDSYISYAEEDETPDETQTSSVSVFTRIINFFNELFDKIRALFGIEKKITPIVPVANNKADVKINFGAYGDGAHDDTKAIQNALDYLKNNGGTVFFPEGTYLISSTIIFYSNQILDFADGAVIKRAALGKRTEPKELRYLLASYTELNSSYGKYGGVHDVEIKGATFDGNENITVDSQITILNLCHTSNIKITDCSFINGSVWHYIECCSSENVYIGNCTFDALSYTQMRSSANEIIQIDAAKGGLYGPVYKSNGIEMRFVKDETPCRNIEIANCLFLCNGFTAIGCHSDYAHDGILIHDNVFSGSAGSRGYINFTNSVKNVNQYDNTIED